MTRVLAADPATEMIDFDAGLAEEPAVEQTLIDKLVGAAVAGDNAARDRLIAEVYPLVLRYCRRRLSRRESYSGPPTMWPRKSALLSWPPCSRM